MGSLARGQREPRASKKVGERIPPVPLRQKGFLPYGECPKRGSTRVRRGNFKAAQKRSFPAIKVLHENILQLAEKSTKSAGIFTRA